MKAYLIRSGFSLRHSPRFMSTWWCNEGPLATDP